MKVLIDKEEFESDIVKFITEGEVKKILSSMKYDTRQFEAGFLTGLAWAAMLTSQLNQWCIEVEPKDEENDNEM